MTKSCGIMPREYSVILKNHNIGIINSKITVKEKNELTDIKDVEFVLCF